MKLFSTRLATTLTMGATLLTVFSAGAAPVLLNTLGSSYTENFDTLASTGTSSALPLGWAFGESGTNANASYTAGTGSSTTGDTYSFGAANSADRAFGTLRSGTLVPTIGVELTNNTGGTITSLLVSYFGEQWRQGTTGRFDRLDFQYSTTATSVAAGVFTDFDALDFVAPNGGSTIGLLDGNLAANRTAINGVVTGLNIASGATFWLRWSDFDATGSDDGLAIDNFSLTANGVPEPGSLALAGVALLALARIRRKH